MPHLGSRCARSCGSLTFTYASKGFSQQRIRHLSATESNIAGRLLTGCRMGGNGYSWSMANEALFTTAGLFGLFVAVLTGALWDAPLLASPIQYLRSQGRHTMRR